MGAYTPTGGGGGAAVFPITTASGAAAPGSIGVLPDGVNHPIYSLGDTNVPFTAGKGTLLVDPNASGGGYVNIEAANYGIGDIPLHIAASTYYISCTAGPNVIQLNGPRTQFGSATTQATVHSNTGAPPNPAYAANIGDLYFRTDTPSTANQRIYICTVAGNPGTWVGIA